MPDPQPSSNGGFITATIEAATGKIIAVRSTDQDGESSELTTDSRAWLSKQIGEASLEDLFEEAFEAGIACVLGDGAEDAEPAESDEDVALRQQILRPMIENSAARRLLQKEVLGQAIIGTLIRKTVAGAPDVMAQSRPSSAA
jgi:hypothetical protein